MKLIEWKPYALYNASLMMFRGLFFTFWVCACLLAFQAKGEATPTFESALSKASLTEDEVSTLTLTAEWPREEGTYQFQLPAFITHNLKIIRRGQSRETFRKDSKLWNRQTFQIELKPVAGKNQGSLQSALLNYVHETSDRTDSFIIPEYQFTFQNTAAKKIWNNIYGVGSTAVLLMILGFWIYRRRRNASQYHSKASHSAGDKTLRGLKQILDSQQDDQKEQLVTLSQKLREFAADHYRVAKPGITDDELIHSLQGLEYPSEEIEPLVRLITELRNAKYVGETLEGQAFATLQERIFQYISNKRVLGGIS